MRLLKAVAVLIVLSVFPVVAVAATVADIVSRYSELKLGEPKQASNVSVSVGHLTLTIPSATAAFVAGKDGSPVGVYYKGSGTFTYETTYADEFPVVRHNAKNSDVPLQVSADKLRIQERFEDVLILGWKADLPGDAATLTPGAFAKHTELFAREQAPPPGHLFALRDLDNPSARAVRVEIDGSRPWVYVLDEAVTFSESLSALRKVGQPTVQFKNALFSTLISEQPAARKPRQERAPRAMLTGVDVALVASDRTEATLTVLETIVPQKRALTALPFDLYSLYYIDTDREPRRFNVRSVTDGRGRSLSFSHASDELVVGLAEPAAPGQPLQLKFEIDGNFLYRPGGDNYWELGVEPWFPQLELNEQGFTFHALVKVKGPFVPFAPGTTLRREVEGDYNVVETKLEQPVQFPAILAGKYHHAEETRNGITVRVAAYAIKNPTAIKQLTNLAFAAIEYYPKFLGPFPFTELNIIEKNDFGYGQAPPATVFITKEAFSPKDEEANEWVKGINSRFAHEIAHQYWGHVVKMGSGEEQWLTESFADYSAAIFLKNARRPSDYDRALNNWKAHAREAGDVSTIPLANRVRNPGFPQLAFQQRFALLYGKGPLLLAALHKELGDQTFLTFLKSYQKSFRWKHGTTADVMGLLQFMTKKDYAPFFEQYFYGTAVPEVARR